MTDTHKTEGDVSSKALRLECLKLACQYSYDFGVNALDLAANMAEFCETGTVSATPAAEEATAA